MWFKVQFLDQQGQEQVKEGDVSWFPDYPDINDDWDRETGQPIFREPESEEVARRCIVGQIQAEGGRVLAIKRI